MRQYLLLTARGDNGSSPGHRVSVIQQAIERSKDFLRMSFPSMHEERTSTWISPNGQVAAVSMSNEPEGHASSLLAETDENIFFGLEGYLTDPSDARMLAHSADPLNDSLQVGGCFAAFIADIHGAIGVTDASGTGGTYWCESQNLRILSNRSLLAHLVALSDDHGTSCPEISLDLLGVRNIANSGFIHGDRTVFRNVNSLGCQAAVYLTPWSVKVRRLQAPYLPLSNEDGWEPAPELIDAIATSLIEAFAPLRGQNLQLSLTGGRDSRILLAAASHVEGMHLATQTRGEVDHPDVVLAQELSGALGIEHKLILPDRSAPDVLLAEEPRRRIQRVLDTHDWAISGWDDAPDYGPFSVNPSMSGVGGEILRGGMVRPGVDTMKVAQLKTSILNQMAGAPKFFHHWLNQAATDEARYYLKLAVANPYEASDQVQRLDRSRHWAASRRAATRLRSDAIDPLFDNKFLQDVLKVPAVYRWNEKLAHDLIKRLAPTIADFPIEGTRWRFDRNVDPRKLQTSERQAWERRTALSKPTGQGIKPWQALDSGTMRSHMRTFIADHLYSSDYGIFNKKEVMDLVEGDSFDFPPQIWHIATALEMFNSARDLAPRARKNLSIEVRDAPGLASPTSSTA